MQGNQSERRLVVTQYEWDRMLTSSGWNEEQLAEKFIVAQPPSVHVNFIPDFNSPPPPDPTLAQWRRIKKRRR